MRPAPPPGFLSVAAPAWQLVCVACDAAGPIVMETDDATEQADVWARVHRDVCPGVTVSPSRDNE